MNQHSHTFQAFRFGRLLPYHRGSAPTERTRGGFTLSRTLCSVTPPTTTLGGRTHQDPGLGNRLRGVSLLPAIQLVCDGVRTPDLGWLTSEMTVDSHGVVILSHSSSSLPEGQHLAELPYVVTTTTLASIQSTHLIQSALVLLVLMRVLHIRVFSAP
uniref:Uncharacterized protein n=1 Tax=Pipistrellus kuhlii TaxID=59472 RepID=A0A7J8B2P8_PIPKU|nr:hypothetical protein mPipKuh1_007921 [Pipistrellus kuhlii]